MLNLSPGGRIMGIGFIHNMHFDKRIKIYNQGNYNRYIYKSKYRIDREGLEENVEKVFQFLDKICFYGADHIKRGQGILKVPYKKIKEFRVENMNLISYLFSLFKSKFDIT